MLLNQVHRLTGLTLIVVTIGALAACQEEHSTGTLEEETSISTSESAKLPQFIEVARQCGLDFTHFNGMSGQLYYLEMMGPGVGLFDFDNDGDLDVYVGQGHFLGDRDVMEHSGPEASRDGAPVDRLFRNDSFASTAGEIDLSFVDVTQRAKLVADGYAMGVAVGDFDNDGWPDLYLSNFGPNQLWHNQGDGTFLDITATSDVAGDSFSASSTFVDYDLDGKLDLVVGDYIEFSLESSKTCYSAARAPDYCGPATFDPLANRLYRNLGDGKFRDVSAEIGLGLFRGRTLGVVASDFNDDGWPDIYFANDGEENELWLSEGDGRLENVAALAGAAVNAEGAPEGSMGVDAGDFDNDGDQDLFMTHIDKETNTLYSNQGMGDFVDVTLGSGLDSSSWLLTGFGTGLFDFDNDGLLDILVVNGAVRKRPDLMQQGDPFPLHEPNLLYRNLGDGGFEEISDLVGGALTVSRVSRGAAFGDIDNDGDTDIVIANNSGPLELLLNEVSNDRLWLGIQGGVEGSGERSAGARYRIEYASGNALNRRSRSGGSYLSTSDPRVRFGLGLGLQNPSLSLHRAGREIHRWAGVPPGRYLVLDSSVWVHEIRR